MSLHMQYSVPRLCCLCHEREVCQNAKLSLIDRTEDDVDSVRPSCYFCIMILFVCGVCVCVCVCVCFETKIFCSFHAF